MIKFYPSFLTFTSDRRERVVTISGEGVESLTLPSIRPVRILTTQHTLQTEACTSIPISLVGKLQKNNTDARFTITMSDSLSELLHQCKRSPTELLAIEVAVPTSSKESVGIQSTLLIPIFDTTKHSLLGGQEVLGEISKNLIVDTVTCTPQFQLYKKDLHCQTTITNATEYPVLSTLVVTSREQLPPGLTKHERLERTNLLLLPQQSYSLNFSIPETKFSLFQNTVAVTASFSDVSNQGGSIRVSQEYTFWYLPLLLVIGISSALLSLSAILLRKNIIKFITLPTLWLSKKRGSP